MKHPIIARVIRVLHSSRVKRSRGREGRRDTGEGLRKVLEGLPSEGTGKERGGGGPECTRVALVLYLCLR